MYKKRELITEKKKKKKHSSSNVYFYPVNAEENGKPGDGLSLGTTCQVPSFL